METTLDPCSWTNSSSCSRIDGVMCALTCAVRFSRISEETPGAEGQAPGDEAHATLEGGGRVVRGSSHCPYMPSMVTGVRSTIFCAHSGRGRRSMYFQAIAVRFLTPIRLQKSLRPTCLM